MGLEPEPISTQVIPRDRHAAFFATLGVIASSIENVAIEIQLNSQLNTLCHLIPGFVEKAWKEGAGSSSPGWKA